MKKFILFLGIIVLVSGCAFTKQAIQDYQTGKTTPIQANEETPAQKAEVLSNTVSSLPVPFAPAAAGAVGFLATIFFTWQRGASIRKTGAPPASSEASNAPHLVQDLANVVAGAFTLIRDNGGITGTILQRMWKVGLATAASGAAVAAADPSVASFLGAHPLIDMAFVAISSGIAGLEKGLSNVPAPATTTSVTA